MHLLPNPDAICLLKVGFMSGFSLKKRADLIPLEPRQQTLSTHPKLRRNQVNLSPTTTQNGTTSFRSIPNLIARLSSCERTEAVGWGLKGAPRVENGPRPHLKFKTPLFGRGKIGSS